jgi:hypothetical protein
MRYPPILEFSSDIYLGVVDVILPVKRWAIVFSQGFYCIIARSRYYVYIQNGLT